MRSADGFTGADSAADALADDQVGPVATNTNLAADHHYFTCDPTGSDPTTPDSAQFLNALVEEFKYILDMGSVGNAAPWAFDATDNSQAATVLAGVAAIYSAAGSTGSVTNRRSRLVAASVASNAAGVASAVIGSDTCTASGVGSTISGSSNSTTAGTQTVVEACEDTDVNGTRNAAMASDGGTINAAFRSGLFATKDSTIAAGSTEAAAVATDGIAAVDLNTTVCLSSDGAVPSPSDGAGTGVTPTKNQVYGGNAGVRNWRINGETGYIYAVGHVVGGADFAEFFPNIKQEAIAAASIVTRRRLGVKAAGEGDAILGVVSENPGTTGNSGGETAGRDGGKDWTVVALLGQVPVKVDKSITNENIDLVEASGGELCVRALDGGVGAWAFGTTRLVAMEMIEDGLCMCLIR